MKQLIIIFITFLLASYIAELFLILSGAEISDIRLVFISTLVASVSAVIILFLIQKFGKVEIYGKVDNNSP